MRILTILFALFLVVSSATAQKTVSGTIVDVNNEALEGVNVLEFNTSNGIITDSDGDFQLTVAEDAILKISYIGFETKNINVADGSAFNIVLQYGVELDEIVVTALGISREKKGLTYSVDEIESSELTSIKDVNVINNIAGKVSGVVINKSGGGVGGSTRITLRGNSSLTNNEPLIVIDGIPMTNNRRGQQGSIFGGGIDSGDGIGNINPEDIESMSVLKGASASALYGSQAANGVILITTKSGKSGKMRVNFSTSLIAETAAYQPELQYKYGQTSDGAEFSWGSVVDASDHVTDFFDMGINSINAISLSGGSGNMSTYFSYSNTNASGIIPTNKLNRHNFNFNQSAKFFDEILSVKGSVNFINQDVDNRSAGGLYFNPLTGLYFFPRGLDFNEYKDNYETFDDKRNFNTQNWIADRDIQQNPYWILNRNTNENIRNRVISSLSARLKLTDALSVSIRGNIDKSIDRFEQKNYATTQTTLADENGRYILLNSDDTQTYGDIILSYNDYINDNISFDANIGASNTKSKIYTESFDSQGANLRFANEFSLQNILQPNSNMFQRLNRLETQAVFASAQVGLNSTWFLDVTARNDWTSSLPDQSFLYPSVGLSAVLSELIRSNALDYAKIRASYAQVGNGVRPYVVNPINENNGISSVTGLIVNTVGPLPGTTLQPEISKSFEVGLETRILNNRLGLDLTYYKTNTIDQFLQINAPLGSGFTQYLVNAGDIQNSGIEALLSYEILDRSDITWNASLNYTSNVNEIKSLHPELDDGVFFINSAGVNSYAMVVREGGSFGDIYGRKFARDDSGRILIDAEGRPRPTEGALEFVGNPNPDFMLGFNNQINYKSITLRFLIDGRFGGEVMSVTEALLDEFGVSKRTGDARDAGSVSIDGVLADGSPINSLDPEAYYTAIGGRAGITEAYVYDATNIRLREFSVGFALPKRLFQKTGLIDNAQISLISRNLFFLKNNAPFDPDITFSTGVGFQGVDVFSLPSTRSLGVSLSVGF